MEGAGGGGAGAPAVPPPVVMTCTGAGPAGSTITTLLMMRRMMTFCRTGLAELPRVATAGVGAAPMAPNAEMNAAAAVVQAVVRTTRFDHRRFGARSAILALSLIVALVALALLALVLLVLAIVVEHAVVGAALILGAG